MTLPPEKLGDKNQRYLVLLRGYPEDQTHSWQVAAYCATPDRAEAVRESLSKAPGCTDSKVFDRIWTGKVSGYFVSRQPGDLGSGPWGTEEAAMLVLEGDFDGAYELGRKKRRERQGN